MRNLVIFTVLVFALVSAGCETVHDGLEKTGEAVGEGMNAAGGFTEGAAKGYGQTTPTEEENPYNR